MRVLAELRRTHSDAALYVCHKALQPTFISSACKPGTPKIWIAAAKTDDSRTSLAKFEQRFRERTGAAPNPGAHEMYDAVRLIAAGVRAAGPNRARLRDSLAKMGKLSGNFRFDFFRRCGE